MNLCPFRGVLLSDGGWFAMLVVAAAILQRAHSAQPLEIEWQRSYSGPGGASACIVRPTSEGGYAALGSSQSAPGGNKTSPAFGSMDYWLLRLDGQGNILWQQSHGGSGTDLSFDLLTLSNGFVLMGFSDSLFGGNKTNANNGSLADIWLVRLDKEGNKLWDHTVGTSRLENTPSVGRTSDERIIVGAWYQPTSIPPHNDSLLWFLDANGNILSNFTFFGHQTNRVESVQQTADGEYIMAGESRNAGGFGGLDYWFARLDSGGTLVWERVYGGTTNDVLKMAKETSDGGFLLAGYTASGVGGNKTSIGYGSNDFWFIRLDAAGNKLWERSCGGTGNDQFASFMLMPDGGFVAVGGSDSPAGGTKTAPNRGALDGWVVRFDASGNQLWDITLGGTNLDGINSIAQTADGGFILGADSLSGATGNKTTPLIGVVDMWVIKLASDGPRLRWEPCCVDDVGPQWSLLLSGISNLTYRTEVSTNLIQWAPYRTNQVLGSEVVLTQGRLDLQPQRFFRARSLP